MSNSNFQFYMEYKLDLNELEYSTSCILIFEIFL